MKFSGFPRGTQYTPVPSPLLGPLLQDITDPAELKCTLRAISLLHQKRGFPRYVTSAELMADRVLRAGLKGLEVPPQEAIRKGLQMALDRGTLVALGVERAGRPQELYFLNDHPGQWALEMVQRGQSGAAEGPTPPSAPEQPEVSRANIFTLYEENIGMVTPLLAEVMVQAESAYPWAWIEEAFRLAVGRNKRSWRYIEAMLERWAREGKNHGESGGHTEKVSLKEYLRRQGTSPNGE